jgi:[protein-PII] uridylyltransferase
MMRAVSAAQELDLRLGEDIKDVIRRNLAAVRRDWQRSPQMADEFLAMLRRPGKVGPALRAMHSCGLLAKYLPEFSHVTRLVQADNYHRYTIDEHTLRAIELLDEIWRKPKTSMQRYRDLTVYISDPAPLYLALLLHDSGKGLGGGHSEKGAAFAVAVCERMKLAPDKSARIELLIRQHLVLSHLSQRRDLSDRSVAQGAAAIIGDVETLCMLCLLTYADTAAVGPEIWTEWKNALLWELYTRVHAELLGLEHATEQEEARLRDIRERVQQALQTKPAAAGEPCDAATARKLTEDHLSLLPPRYALGYQPDLIARQIVLAGRAVTAGASIDLIPVPGEGFTILVLCCRDTPGLFAKAAGTLASMDVNIMGARLDTRQDGMAVDVLWISTASGSVIDDPARLRRIAGMLEGVLNNKVAFEDVLQRLAARATPAAQKPPRISVSNSISELCTVIEVLAQDRLGFAYSMADCFNRLGLNIVFAKLATEKAMVFDVFYVTDRAGSKVPEESWPAITDALTAAAERGPGKLPNQSPTSSEEPRPVMQ